MIFTTETKRLYIEPVTIFDSAFIFELLNTEGWIKFIGDRNIHSPEDAESYIQKIIDNPKSNYWICKLKENKTPVGIVSFIKRNYLDAPDIGFALLPAYQKNGFAFEATSHVLEGIKKIKSFDAIKAFTLYNNSSSISLLEKLGLAFEKEIQDKEERLFVYSIEISNKLD